MTHLGLRAADQVAGLPELSWHLSEALVRARLTLDATKERRSAPSISNIRNQAFAYARDLQRTAMRVTRSPCLAYRQQHLLQADR